MNKTMLCLSSLGLLASFLGSSKLAASAAEPFLPQILKKNLSTPSPGRNRRHATVSFAPLPPRNRPFGEKKFSEFLVLLGEETNRFFLDTTKIALICKHASAQFTDELREAEPGKRRCALTHLMLNAAITAIAPAESSNTIKPLLVRWFNELSKIAVELGVIQAEEFEALLAQAQGDLLLTKNQHHQALIARSAAETRAIKAQQAAQQWIQDSQNLVSHHADKMLNEYLTLSAFTRFAFAQKTLLEQEAGQRSLILAEQTSHHGVLLASAKREGNTLHVLAQQQAKLAEVSTRIAASQLRLEGGNPAEILSLELGGRVFHSSRAKLQRYHPQSVLSIAANAELSCGQPPQLIYVDEAASWSEAVARTLFKIQTTNSLPHFMRPKTKVELAELQHAAEEVGLLTELNALLHAGIEPFVTELREIRRRRYNEMTSSYGSGYVDTKALAISAAWFTRFVNYLEGCQSPGPLELLRFEALNPNRKLDSSFDSAYFIADNETALFARYFSVEGSLNFDDAQDKIHTHLIKLSWGGPNTFSMVKRILRSQQSAPQPALGLTFPVPYHN